MPTRPAVVALVAAGALLGAPAATAAPTTTTDTPLRPAYEIYCQPADPGLAELSGTTFAGASLYGIGDSGSDDRFAQLAPDCAVQQWIDVPVEPYDIEDMTNHVGMLWLSDTGDNLRRRDTVALTRVDPRDGTGELHRLTYSDGRHDAEALFVEPGGRPVIVTKEFSGPAGIYVPAGDATVQTLPSPGPTPLVQAGAVTLGAPTSTGVPAPGQLVTGAALSEDGRVAALRTYAEIYLYPVRGDVVAALTTGTPVTVAAPQQPQGESLAFTSSGDLLVGSENGGDAKPLPPIMVLRHAIDLVAPRAESTTAASPADHSTRSASWWWAGGAVIAGLAVIAAAVTLRRR